MGDYGKLIELSDKYSKDIIFTKNPLGKAFYDLIIKDRSNNLNTPNVEDMEFIKLVKSLIDLNKKINEKLDIYKNTISGNVQFVKESTSLFEKAIVRKKAEKEGLETLEKFKSDRVKPFTDKINQKE